MAKSVEYRGCCIGRGRPIIKESTIECEPRPDEPIGAIARSGTSDGSRAPSEVRRLAASPVVWSAVGPRTHRHTRSSTIFFIGGPWAPKGPRQPRQRVAVVRGGTAVPPRTSSKILCRGGPAIPQRAHSCPMTAGSRPRDRVVVDPRSATATPLWAGGGLRRAPTDRAAPGPSKAVKF
jgi:hypothetical protein